jgi:hypothetical protein
MSSEKVLPASQLKPLSQSEVRDEAEKLESLAGQFLSGKDESAAFAAWHHEFIEIARHGMDSVKSVYKQMESDTSAPNPFLPGVHVSEHGENQQIEVRPSVVAGTLGVNYRNIGSIVSPEDVSSAAIAGRNVVVGQHELFESTPKRNWGKS